MITLTPAPASPFVARVAQPPQHHGEGREAQVGLGLAAARREEEQVDRLAVGVARVGEAGEVQQDEGELEGAPARRPRCLSRCAQRPRDGPVRHAEGVEGVGVLPRARRCRARSGRRRCPRSAAAPRPSRAALAGRAAMPRAAPRSTPGTASRAAAAPPRPRRHRRAPRAPPSRARRPARPRSPSSRPRRSGSTPCGADGMRRPRSPSRPRRHGRSRTRACRRSGDRPPARPTPRPARRAGPAAARRGGRFAPRARAGRRRRGRAPPVGRRRAVVHEEDRDRARPLREVPARDPRAEISRSTTWSWRPPESGTSCTTGSVAPVSGTATVASRGCRCQTESGLPSAPSISVCS